MPTHDVPVRVIARLARLFETRLSAESMSLPQFRVLAFLSDGEWAASALADWLTVSRPSITAMVDGLVERGWVERRDSPDDRRRVLHHLTADGRAALDTAGACLEDALGSVLEHLAPDERERALDGLQLIGVAMRRQREAVTS